MNLDFIQIGAGIGNTVNDPVYPRIKNGEFKTGLLCECNPRAFELLQKTYKDKNFLFENVAVGDRNETINFYIDNYDNVLGSSQHGSCVLEHQHKHLHGLGRDIITTLTVPCVTLNSLIKKYEIEIVNWLFIDTEGYDYKILITTDFSKFKPKYIHFESCHTDGPHHKAGNYDNLMEYLKSVGYKNIKNSGYEDTIVSL